MIVEHQVGESADEVHVEDVSTVGVAAEGAASVADDEVPTVIDEPSIPSPPPPTQPPPPSQDLPSTSQVETFDDTDMDDVSKQGRIITDMDVDKDVNLKDVATVAKDVQDAKIEESLDVQGRKAKS
nr:hypothetical protein [Tanacetum cinerariifolium]